MNSITFTIDRTEIENIAGKELSPEITEKILSLIENDMALWNDIEKSIIDAIEESLED